MKLDSFAVIDGIAVVIVIDGDQTIERRIYVGPAVTHRTQRTQTERYWVFRDGATMMTLQVNQATNRTSLYLADKGEDVANVHGIPHAVMVEIFTALDIPAPQPWLSCPVCYGSLQQKAPGRFDCLECLAKTAINEIVHA